MNLSEIASKMNELKDWSLEGNSISKNFEFKDFKESITFVNDVAEISEKHNHHPDITIRFKEVILVLTTHSANGLTEKDFEVAKEIDTLN